LTKYFDTFFHLPTLITIAILSVIIFWEISDAGLYLGEDFVRLTTNQGSITLDWLDGCCDVDW
jgi:hypothetical protein